MFFKKTKHLNFLQVYKNIGYVALVGSIGR